MATTLSRLIEALQGLQDQEDNALPEFPVVIRVDLGPEQEFHIAAVYLADPAESDPYVVIDTGPVLLPGEDPRSDLEESELW